MMERVATLARWEWFKLRRRLMPWVLLVLLVMVSQVFVFGTYFSYRSLASDDAGPRFGYGGDGPPIQLTCREIMAGEFPEQLPQEIRDDWRFQCAQFEQQRLRQLADMHQQFTLPGSLPVTLGIAQNIGLVLIAILAASNLGTDYGWGTLRTVLVRGTGRWQYLAGKLALMTVLSGVALVIVGVVTLGTSALVGALASAPDGAASAAAQASWSTGLVTLLKAWFAVLPFLALATCVTVLTTSSAAGMAVALAYYFLEQIVVTIMVALFDWFEPVADFVLGRNIAGWMSGVGGGLVVGGVGQGELPGVLHAFFVLVVYIVALAGLAFWRFQRRDVAGAVGT